jgi:hypothetical protein
VRPHLNFADGVQILACSDGTLKLELQRTGPDQPSLGSFGAAGAGAPTQCQIAPFPNFRLLFFPQIIYAVGQ